MELKDLENIAIRCETEDEANRCCELADRLGWTWWQGDSYVDTDNCWSWYKNETCYNFIRGTYQSTSHWKEHGLNIKPASWFLENFKIQNMETKEKNGSIAEMYACANEELKKVLEGKFTKEELGIKEELPNTWEEFCEQNLIKDAECYINRNCEIVELEANPRNHATDRNILPSEESANAFIALMQLEQLRDKYRQGWLPDWFDNGNKFTIYKEYNSIQTEISQHVNHFLAFQSEKLRDKFYDNFIELIKTAKDLI